MLMKIINKILTFFVGATFILSGLIKVNDPKGTAIKLEEYFDVFAADVASPLVESFFLGLIPYALIFSVVISTLEVVLGVGLIANISKRLTLRVTFLLLLFFGFLTFYSAYFDKVTDCGCFGDAIKFTPWQSFAKDMVLLLATLILILTLPKKRRRYFYPHPSPLEATKKRFRTRLGVVSVLLSLTGCISIAIYSIKHLPIKDFRPYKVGASIPEQMLPEEECQYVYIMEKDGEQVELKDYPSDKSYKYIEMKTLNEEKCNPVISDYTIYDENGDDMTEETLTGVKLFVVVQLIEDVNQNSFSKINPLISAFEQTKSGKAIAITSDPTHFEEFRHKVQLGIPYYSGDATVLKAMVRANPGILLVRDGVVLGKWHHNDTPDIETISGLLK